VKSSLRVQQSISPGMSSGKFDDSFDPFTAGVTEEDFGQLSSGEPAEARGKFDCQFRDVTLKHRRAATIEFGLERGDDGRMVMPAVVDAVSGEEVENAIAISGMQSAPTQWMYRTFR